MMDKLEVDDLLRVTDIIFGTCLAKRRDLSADQEDVSGFVVQHV